MTRGRATEREAQSGLMMNDESISSTLLRSLSQRANEEFLVQGVVKNTQDHTGIRRSHSDLRGRR